MNWYSKSVFTPQSTLGRGPAEIVQKFNRCWNLGIATNTPSVLDWKYVDANPLGFSSSYNIALSADVTTGVRQQTQRNISR